MIGRWTATLRRELRHRAWQVFLVIGVAMTVGYYLLPTPEAKDLFYQFPAMVAVVAIVLGVRLFRPPHPGPWYLLAAGLLLSTAGDWSWVVLDRAFGLEPFPSVADVFYLAGMAAIALAIVGMLRGRMPGGDRAGILDALIVAVGIGLVTWVFVMEPIVADASQSIGEIAVALAYPLIDVLLLGVLVRLVLAPGEKGVSLRLLIGAVLAFLAADYPYALLALNDGYEVGHFIDAGWLMGSVLWGASALHPSMRTIGRPVPDAETRLSAWRLALLAAASLMAPAVLVVEWARGSVIDVRVVAGGSVVLFLLVIARLHGVVRDLRRTLDQRAVLEKELERRALHDPLTGLANRVLFQDRLQHALARRDGSVAVMFLDLDDFKTVNDSMGHDAGDTVLRSVASSLADALRPEDTIARLGGDEFAVLLADSPDRYTASQVAGRLLEAVQVPVELAGYRQSTGVSIGIALGAAGAATSDQLMRDADIAMYVAKGQGKGTFTLFEPTEHSAVVRGLELRNDLDSAIIERQFELEFQPIVDLDTGGVAGVEALVRWRHPTLGVLSPAEFIPLAETTGAIVPLGRWILRAACTAAIAWPDGADGRAPGASGAPGATPFLAVNLSGVQIAEPGFAQDVHHILLATGFPPERLVLELTETSRLDQVAATDSLVALRALGVRLAIDDFGTGFAALSHLSRTTFDMVKIDRSFVSSIGPDARAESLVTGILDLARRMRLVVVAEGIEDGVQLARLRSVGCQLGQGYLFARPMPPTELATFLRDAAAAPVSSAAPAHASRPEIRPA